MKVPKDPGSALAEAQVPVDLAFWDGNGVSSYVNVDFPLGKMIDSCCAIAVNRQYTGTIKVWDGALCAGEAVCELDCDWIRVLMMGVVGEVKAEKKRFKDERSWETEWKAEYRRVKVRWWKGAKEKRYGGMEGE